MKMPLLATLFVDAESTSSAGAPPRLRDLIFGLHNGTIPAATFLDRLDPAFADEIRAFVCHRGLSAEIFLVNALLTFALDMADESWRQAVRARQAQSGDAEADTLADLFAQIMRQQLERQTYLAWPRPASESPATFARRRG